jgi:DMSO/TMAO reductase YedYZ molybdopterin-dependent catalytic subunit
VITIYGFLERITFYKLIIPRMYAYKGVKWVEKIVFTEKQEAGYWEHRGYPVDGSIPGLRT